ncbi:MAG: hypothetical protein IT204_25320 [Fimbriimonadaceae bacterium]|nr:hypothetical protein [Fimbriimonadaceae bacterium]
MWLTLSLLWLTAPAPRGVVGDCPPALAAEVLQIEWPGTGPWWAPREVAGHTVVRFGDVVVVEPTVTVTLDALLRDVPEPYQALLRRGEDGPEDLAPEQVAPLTDAAFILTKGLDDDESRQRLREVACWMAGPAVARVWRQQEQRLAGTPWVRLVPTPLEPQAPLIGVVYYLDPRPVIGGSLRVELGQVGLDRFARKQAAKGGALPAEEYRRRLLAATRAGTGIGRDRRLDVAIDLDQVATIDELAGLWAVESSVPLAVEPAVAARPVLLRADRLPAREALLALARLAGAELTATAEGYRLTAPRETGALLARNTPLRWWPATQFTVNDQYAAEDDLRAACYTALGQAGQDLLRDEARRLGDLPPAATPAFGELLEEVTAWHWAALRPSLPDEAGQVRMKCWYHSKWQIIELSLPGYSEQLTGLAVAQFLARAAGVPAFSPDLVSAWGGGQ